MATKLSQYQGMKRVGAATKAPRGARALVAKSVAPRVSARGVQPVIECKKVAVLGAAGGIGQSLSLLMKMSPYITDLALYDIANTPGVACDLSHCDTVPAVKGYVGEDQLAEALTGCDLVVIPAGVPRKPGMTRDDLFAINAGIVKGLVEGVATHCPKAILNIISNPVNSTVPIACETLKAKGVFDPKKVIGVTTLDCVRSTTFIAEAKGLSPAEVVVPVIGGHAGITILPLLSQCEPPCAFTAEEMAALTTRIQNAGTEVVEAKAGAGSATLSMAYAAARMAESCLRGLSGEEIVECAYVASSVTELPYFASKVKLGPGGVEEVMDLGELTPFEQEGLAALKPELTGSIEKGVKFVAEN